ncbi:unnamed protein product [Colias eurytheme]|nr:unnamed protein product [Colias eurytheme]
MKRGRKKNTSKVNTKSVQAIDNEINEEDATVITTVPDSAHAYVPSSSTENSLILANVNNKSDFNTSVLNKNLEYTVNPSISTDISHISDSYASLVPDNKENSDPCISSNVSHISDSYESISNKKLESVPLSVKDDNDYSQSMDTRKNTSYFNVSFNDMPDSQMHSFCKLSDMLNFSDMFKYSPFQNKSTSFENNFLLDSRNQISDIPTYVSNSTVNNVPPSEEEKLSAILNHASHLYPENIEKTSTYLKNTVIVEPPPVATEPLAVLDSVSPLNPENIEKQSTYPLSTDNLEPLPVATEPLAILDSASRVDAEYIENNSTYPLSTDIVELLPVTTESSGILNHVTSLGPKITEKNTTYQLNTDEPPRTVVESSTLSHLRHLDPIGNTIINKPTYTPEVSQKPRLELPCILSDDRNQDESVPLFDNESDFSDLSNDKNYEPSSYESSSESDQELLIENECLDESRKDASSYCDKTSPAEKENVSLREDFVRVDSKEKSEERSNENVDTEKDVPEDKNTSEVDLKGENWKFDISSQAADDLNVKKWNKTTMVPLAADLKLFKDYLCAISKQSSDNLTQSEGKTNVEAFNNLVESTYCRVLLLNRRRPGELQRLKLNDYNDHGNDSNKYEEFDKILTSTEKILVDKLKRIVIRGKRGRGVPVLFSIEVQDDIKKILSVRHMYVKDDNNLLFVKAGGTTVCGYKILEKYAKASGAKNYKALTSTRLRKHLATMTQLFTMTELELEQLATFMGHTLSVHKNNYRLPSDIYQTAKISKLLLLMEDGKADEFQGKSLDEIELNMDEEVIGDEIENQEVVDMEIEEAGPSQNINLNRQEQIASTSSQVLTYNASAKKKRTLVPWTNEQKNVVTKYFKDHIKHKKPPKRAECDQLKNNHPTLLHNKDWVKIKVFIQNIYSKK